MATDIANQGSKSVCTFFILMYIQIDKWILQHIGERVVVEDGSVKKGLYQIDENAQVRIIRLQSVRVVMEEDNVIMLYHNYDNPR